MDGNAALKVIRDVGVGGLGGFDGCLCTSFAVQGIEVDVSCRKSSGSAGHFGYTLRVHSRHMDATGAYLEAVAREVAGQLQAIEGYAVRVRYCDYLQDHPAKCIYCGADREDAAGYLCSGCLSGEKWSSKDDPALFIESAKARDYREHEFALPECFDAA